MPTEPIQTAPQRNRYFYGLMMDAARFQKDQDYFNQKRWLLNRFVEGRGVVSGLSLTFDSTAKTLTLGAGIAIDGAGREIIVPAATPVDLSQLTNAQGQPAGVIPAGATVLVSLAYAESAIEPVPVLVQDCDHPCGCAPSAIEEGFTLLVQIESGPTPTIYSCKDGTFPILPNSAFQSEVAGDIVETYNLTPADSSIALGRFTLPDGPLDAVSDRPIVYNNTLLYQMIVCLAVQISKSSAVALTYISGDNQTGPATQALARPLVIGLVDGSGNPVTSGSAPTFSVTEGGGSIGTVTAGAAGQYEAVWTLGASGPQTATAQAAQSNLTVTFHATAQ
jgi:hypothetical protein